VPSIDTSKSEAPESEQRLTVRPTTCTSIVSISTPDLNCGGWMPDPISRAAMAASREDHRVSASSRTAAR
jgi:hypothetical protein